MAQGLAQAPTVLADVVCGTFSTANAFGAVIWKKRAALILDDISIAIQHDGSIRGLAGHYNYAEHGQIVVVDDGGSFARIVTRRKPRTAQRDGLREFTTPSQRRTTLSVVLR